MPGGALIFDNWPVFPGETRAVEELLGRDVHIRSSLMHLLPINYLIQGE